MTMKNKPLNSKNYRDRKKAKGLCSNCGSRQVAVRGEDVLKRELSWCEICLAKKAVKQLRYRMKSSYLYKEEQKDANN